MSDYTRATPAPVPAAITIPVAGRGCNARQAWHPEEVSRRLRIRVLSDLHVEYAPYHYRDAGEDLVVLAGDISDGTPTAAHNREELFDAMRNKRVLYVLGNHEFHQEYGAVGEVVESIRKSLPPHVTLLHRQSVEIDGVLFLGCPLWSDFRLGDDGQRYGHSLGRERAMQAAALAIADFHYLVDSRGEPIGPAGMATLHAGDRAWLDHKIKQAAVAATPTVVITHWLPSSESVAPQYVGSLLSPYFASDCRDLLRDPVQMWIHGHTHVPQGYVHHGTSTKIVCNPRGNGPIRQQEELGFDPNLMVEVYQQKQSRRGRKPVVPLPVSVAGPAR